RQVGSFDDWAPRPPNDGAGIRVVGVGHAEDPARKGGPPICMTNCDTVALVGRAISVRLDDEALRALRQLESAGLTRSRAIRKALMDAAGRLGRREALAAEVRALEADEDDRREMVEVAALMESLR